MPPEHWGRRGEGERRELLARRRPRPRCALEPDRAPPRLPPAAHSCAPALGTTRRRIEDTRASFSYLLRASSGEWSRRQAGELRLLVHGGAGGATTRRGEGELWRW
ncbi:unnamed protein product [Urochloa humidicola]